MKKLRLYLAAAFVVALVVAGCGTKKPPASPESTGGRGSGSAMAPTGAGGIGGAGYGGMGYGGKK